MRRVMLALVLLLVAAPAWALPHFESNWWAFATLDSAQCENGACSACASVQIHWDEWNEAWLVFVTIAEQGANVTDIDPIACGFVPQSWKDSGDFVITEAVPGDGDGEWQVYLRAPFDIESGRYYDLIVGGYINVKTTAANNGGWCLKDVASYGQPLVIGAYSNYGEGEITISQYPYVPGVLVENQCADLPGGKATANGSSAWGAVKGLYK